MGRVRRLISPKSAGGEPGCGQTLAACLDYPLTQTASLDRLTQSDFAPSARSPAGRPSLPAAAHRVLFNVLAKLDQPTPRHLPTRDILGGSRIGELPRRRAERFPSKGRKGRAGGLSFNALSTPSIGAASTGVGHTHTRSGCLRNRHSQNQRRKRGPAARAEAVAFAPALDVIVTATTAVAIGWEVREACIRISPAIAVNPGVSPGEARRSRRRGRTGKSGAGNRHCRAFSADPHEVDPPRKSRRTERVIQRPNLLFVLHPCFFCSWRGPRIACAGKPHSIRQRHCRSLSRDAHHSRRVRSPRPYSRRG
jgi:hypothetical protein